MKAVFLLFSFLPVFAGVPNQEIAFQVDRASDSGALRLAPILSAPYRKAAVQGRPTLAPPINRDFFQRKGITFRVENKWPQPCDLYLIVEHLDVNIGLMQVEYDADRPFRRDGAQPDPAYTRAGESAGQACLGTNQLRKAVFRLSKPLFQHRQKNGGDITIYNVHALYKVTLTPALSNKQWEEIHQNIPRNLAPLVNPAKPLQLVTTAGISWNRSELGVSLWHMEELCPLVRRLGFTGVETYVTWNNVETAEGKYDWSFYDAIVVKLREYDLKWFPLLIVGSEYALPSWYYRSPKDIGFVCLEHGKANSIQSIFCDNQTPYVRAFLTEFGRHYEPMNVLLGVRLGPSGNYGESQYPAGGNWGYAGEKMHIHIGWWAGDPYASPHFARYLAEHYVNIDSLNRSWGDAFRNFAEIRTFIPQFSDNKRKRKDFVDWYLWAMTDWCEKWAVWARQAMPHTDIHQSAGGWGFVESGTDFTDQTRSMIKINGAIRATNETDSYSQNFYATAMMSSAARFYKVPFGTEPAGFGSGRGVAARLYNILVNKGEHLFYYHSNLLDNDQGVDQWLALAPLLDERQWPFNEIAVLYPDTKSKLDDGVFRNLYSFSFNQRVSALRPHINFDFCSEQMILDGALPQYKVLVFLWSDVVEAAVLQRIDDWVRSGGIVIYPYWARMPLTTVEDDYTFYNHWLAGRTGKGQVIFDYGDREPPHRYADFIKTQLLHLENLHDYTKQMLTAAKPAEVYISVLQNGAMAILNYLDEPAEITLSDRRTICVPAYGIKLVHRTE